MSDKSQTTTYYGVAVESSQHQDCAWYDNADKALVNQQRLEYEQGYCAWIYEFSMTTQRAKELDHGI